jgi:hypothetical protein
MIDLPFDIILYILSFNIKIKCPNDYNLSYKTLSKHFYKSFKYLKKKCIFSTFIGLKYCKTHYGHLIKKTYLII